ncbi:helix-turn-helix transcriptional regulator [Myroides sp. 1354]|nr:helix-turn-helix transcriptional regulator [Myroides sp. R163-1]MDM1056776.1 helix-turn-helix transcriptional regulator [Myroides sp. 1354]MDM1069953.1 helix-turn-helix transcriptional regulator [Myroides sp. 1372]
MFWMLVIFSCYSCLFLCAREKNEERMKLFGMSCSIITLNISLYFFDSFQDNRPCFFLSILLFFLQGFGLVYVLKITPWKRYLHLLPFVLFAVFYFFNNGFAQAFIPFSALNKTGILYSSILSFAYANYGYWCLIKGKYYKTLRQFTAFYIVLLYCTSILFLIVYFYRYSFFEYVTCLFLIISTCLLLGALLYEWSLFFYARVKKINPHVTREVDVIEQRLFDKIALDISGSEGKGEGARIDIGFNQISVGNISGMQLAVVEETSYKSAVIREVISEKLIESRLFLNPTLNLDQLADLVQVPKSDLTRFFKESQAITFKQYINRLKVEYAILLIREREESYTVEELSLLCGFNTRLSFYRAFVDVYGFAPSEILT